MNDTLRYANIVATSYCCATVLLRTFIWSHNCPNASSKASQADHTILSLFPSLTWLPSLDYLIWHVSRPVIIAIKGLVAFPPSLITPRLSICRRRASFTGQLSALVPSEVASCHVLLISFTGICPLRPSMTLVTLMSLMLLSRVRSR